MDKQGVTLLPGLRRRRLLAALTQAQLAERAGVERITVTRLENGGHSTPPTLSKLAIALGCTPAELMDIPTLGIDSI